MRHLQMQLLLYRISQEQYLLMCHGLKACRVCTLGPSVVRDVAFCAAAGSSEHKQALAPGDEINHFSKLGV